jgi:hypothetical protein
MNRHSIFTLAVVIAALATTKVRAQNELWWEGGNGNFVDSNYTNETAEPDLTDQPPGATDYIHIGLDSNLTLAESRGVGRLRVGQNQTVGGKGAGTLTVTGNGTELGITAGLDFPDFGLLIGNQFNGTVNLEEGALITVNQLVAVGAGNNNTATGTLNVRTGGRLTINAGNLNIGDRTPNNNGNKGVVNIDDSTSVIELIGSGSDILLGVRQRTGMYNQTAGTVTMHDSIEIGPNGGSSNGSTFTISGGSVSTGVGGNGNIFIGLGASQNATMNISGTADVNVGNRFLIGGSASDTVFGTTPQVAKGFTNHSSGTLDIDVDMRIGDSFESAASEGTYNLSGTGVITTNVAALPADPLTTSNIIGRRGIGRFIQTGGTANFNSPLEIGNREATGATIIAANGLYKISAGDLNVNAPTTTWPLGLDIAPNGTGEFRVVGDDATIDVTGDFAISSTANGNGTLAFELETGDLLSQINVTGAATFNDGSILTLDVTNAAPSQSSYDLLAAASIVDSGISFSGPAGWGYEIVTVGSGQVLRIAAGLAPELAGDHNKDGVVDAADHVAWRKLDIDGPAGYTDFVENFNEPTAGAGGRAGGGQVPEPTSAGLLLIAMSTIIGGGAIRRR